MLPSVTRTTGGPPDESLGQRAGIADASREGLRLSYRRLIAFAMRIFPRAPRKLINRVTMQLPLENWLVEAALPEEANVAFLEAARCYKSAAYRAALLFSYLGWGLTIRQRVLLAQCPSGIKETHWLGFGEKLRSDDRWESQVFDCTQMTQPASIFDVSEDLRQQVKFWRDRRNDCAHFKANEIAAPHVEAFWLFVRSNMTKFVPRGTKAALIEEIRTFFDANRTPPDSDVRPLAKQITQSIEPGQATVFFREMVEEFGIGHLGSFSEPVKLFEGLFAVNSPLGGSLSDYLATETWLLVPLLRQNPGRVLNWTANRELIRRLWRELLFTFGHQDLPVYAALLRNGLIPTSEIDEANKWIAAKLNGDIPTGGDLEVLLRSNFVSQFSRYAFDEFKIDEFAWGNRNAQTIRWYIETFPLTCDVAQIICRAFASPPFPYEVRDALGSLLETNEAKRQELESQAFKAGVSVPANILTAAKPGG
jgi:hypothetical protein